MKKIILFATILSLISVFYGCSQPEQEISSEPSEIVAESGLPPSSAPESSEPSSSEPASETSASEPAATAEAGTLTVSFDFNKSSGKASNQYAVWIENEAGDVVKTLFVTDFAATGGYETREDTLPAWVSRANPAGLPAETVDAIGGATPDAGAVSYTWDGTDESGEAVESGNYAVLVEGTLLWTSNVLFRGEFSLDAENADIDMISTFSEEGTDNRTMMDAVSASYLK